MTRKPRRSWTDEEKQTIATEVRRRLSAGESLRRIAKSLGIYESTLRLWLNKSAAGNLQPVAIRVDAPAATNIAGGISIATPDGFLFDGLDLIAAIKLWEHIR